MGDSRAVIIVIVGILILGTLGFSQNAEANHEYSEKADYWFKKYNIIGWPCIWTGENVRMWPFDTTIIPDVDFGFGGKTTHDPCVFTLKNNVVQEKTIYNHGKIIITPTSKPVINSGTIINYGTIIINPIPEAPKEKQDEYHADFARAWGGLFTGYGEPPPPPKEWKNFVNTGTIINYGTITNHGEMISTGKIINKGSVGLFGPSGTFYNRNLLVNSGAPIENGGSFHNYYGIVKSTTAIHDYCGSITQNPNPNLQSVGTIEKCVPVTFEKPVDKYTICENQHPTFEWTDSNPWASQKYKFWLTPFMTSENILEEARLPKGGNYNSWEYQINYNLPPGGYDYYVARVDDATGAVMHLPDVQTILVKTSDGNCPSIKESITFGDPIIMVISSNFNVRASINSGSLQIDDLVVFVNDGTNMYEKSLTAQSVGGYSNESLKLLVNPKGENGVLVDNRLSSLEHNNEVYSFKYGGDCDDNGAVTLVEAKTFSDKTDWKCTITFDYLGDKPPEPTYDPSVPVEIEDPPPVYPPANFVLPNDIIVEAIDDGGAAVNYPTVTATDVLNANVPVQCSPSSGSVFPVGVTIVKCSAIKDQGYPFEDEFKVTVKPPSSIFDLPYDMVFDATSENGAVVDYPAVTGVDPTGIDPTGESSGQVLIADCDPASGSVFSVGHNTVFCFATDSEGNTRTGIFGVTVIPYTPPTPEPISELPKLESGPWTPPPTPEPTPPTPEPTPPTPEPTPPTPESLKEQKIPSWIKNNAEWWAQGAIGDSDFVSGIQYLIKEGIMQIPETRQTTTVDGTEEIPSWIKNNAEWWAQGLISDDDFVKGIQYLVEQGIMVV